MKRRSKMHIVDLSPTGSELLDAINQFVDSISDIAEVTVDYNDGNIDIEIESYPEVKTRPELDFDVLYRGTYMDALYPKTKINDSHSANKNNCKPNEPDSQRLRK